jgi:hypothetical protein
VCKPVNPSCVCVHVRPWCEHAHTKAARARAHTHTHTHSTFLTVFWHPSPWHTVVVHQLVAPHPHWLLIPSCGTSSPAPLPELLSRLADTPCSPYLTVTPVTGTTPHIHATHGSAPYMTNKGATQFLSEASTQKHTGRRFGQQYLTCRTETRKLFFLPTDVP